MLRITLHGNSECLTFKLEGGLACLWVGELKICCRRTVAGRRLAVRFDLSEMTFIDTAGKAFLAAMHRQGTEFIAADCLTRAVVAEIAKATFPTEGVRGAKAKVRHN